MKALALISLVVAACAPAFQMDRPAFAYYVAAVRPARGALVAVHRCGLDVQGRPTGYCYDEVVAANSPTALVAEKELARSPLPAAPVPAPTLRDVMRVVNDGDVHARVESCRRDFAPEVARVRFSLTVMPSGDPDGIELPAALNARFADCTKDAVLAARFGQFDAQPQRYDLMMVL